MIKRTLLFAAVVTLTLTHSSLSQDINWTFGIQGKYGISNFKFGFLNDYIDAMNEMLKEQGVSRRLDHFSSGTMLGGELIVKPHRLCALSIGIMPQFKAERQYDIPRQEGDVELFFKAKGTPAYFGAYFYIPAGFYMVQPFIAIKAGEIKNAELLMETRDTGNNKESSTITGRTNYYSFALGFDYYMKSYLILTSTAGYQLAKVEALKDDRNYTVYWENYGKVTLDFSGSFLKLGLKVVF